MSRKRYSSGSQRWSPNQGKQKSTSTQLASYDDSLTADCLIRTFMEKGNMEDPILKMLFIGGSRPRENETWNEGIFKSPDEGSRNTDRNRRKMGQISTDGGTPYYQPQNMDYQTWRGEKIFKRFLIGKISGLSDFIRKRNQN